MSQAVTRRFEPWPASVPAGRHFAEERLREWGVDGRDPTRALLADVLTVVTELLSNAVNAASGDVELTMGIHRSHVHIAVIDDSPAKAAPGQPDPDGLSGRGLAIVAALSHDWGQTPFLDARKTVWADVAFVPK